MPLQDIYARGSKPTLYYSMFASASGFASLKDPLDHRTLDKYVKPAFIQGQKRRKVSTVLFLWEPGLKLMGAQFFTSALNLRPHRPPI